MKNADSVIAQLRTIDLKQINYPDLVNLILKIGEIAINEITIPKGSYIFRSRTEKELIRFENFSDISIRLDINNITPGRCNWFNTPIFYGVVPFNSFDMGEALSFWETSKIIGKESLNEMEEEYAATGLWFVKEDIRTAAIVTHKAFADVNPALNYFYEAFQKNVQNLSDPNYFATLAEYVSALFSQKQNLLGHTQYSLTSALSYIHFSAGMEGILYPSAATKGDGEGLNVALSKEAVGKLKFDRAIIRRIYYSHKGQKTISDPYLRTVSVGSKGELTWEASQTILSRAKIEGIMSQE